MFLLDPDPRKKAGLWVLIRIGSLFYDFVDTVSGSKGKKMKQKLHILVNFFSFYNKRSVVESDQSYVLDPHPMTL
jgi:hypothetical protein